MLPGAIFREWVRVRSPDDKRVSIIWGYCIVHMAQPQFSGNVIHTSKIARISKRAAYSLVETRNSLHILLGPELHMPAGQSLDPSEFIAAHRDTTHKVDAYSNAAINADPDCPKCRGTGTFVHDERQTRVCDACCKHNVGWWMLEGYYGANNGKWACKAGCGLIVDQPPPVLEFLPRAKYTG
jgi:hypothetical protein